MRLAKRGRSTSAVEVLNISPHGFWIMVNDKEYFLPFSDFPWFKNATVVQLHNVELVHGYHLHWPDLDMDLELSCLERPHQYPLRAQP